LVAPSEPVYHAETLYANPLGFCAGLETLQSIQRVNAHALLEERTGTFCDELNGEMEKSGLPFQLTRTASIFWLHARTNDVIRRIDQIPSAHSSAFAKVFHGALSRGVYLAPSGFEVSFMSLAHDDELLEKAMAGILASISI